MAMLLPVASLHKIGIETDNTYTGSIVRREWNLTGRCSKIPLTALRKLDKIFYRGPTKAVECLIIITYYTNIAVASSELEEETFLDSIGILVFVNEDMLEYALCASVALEHLQGSLLEERKVGQVHATANVQRLLIGRIHR